MHKRSFPHQNLFHPIKTKSFLKDAKEDSAIYEILSNGSFKLSTDGGLTEYAFQIQYHIL